MIQCLLPSAVTSLGSPARPCLKAWLRALSGLDQRVQELERGGSHPAALFCRGLQAAAQSETAEIDEARAAAVFDDALAAIDGRTAVVAEMAGDAVPIARLRRRRLWCTQSGGIADDRGWLASHDRLLEWGALARVLLISREPATPRSRAIRYIVFPECFVGHRNVGTGRGKTSSEGSQSGPPRDSVLIESEPNL